MWEDVTMALAEICTPFGAATETARSSQRVGM